MRYWVSWQQWEKWSADDDLQDEAELLQSMKDMTDYRPVTQFMEKLQKYLCMQLLREVNAHMANPNRQQRSYSDALRELSIVVNNLLERGGK